MHLDVVICTHDPRRSVLQRVIRALARQTAGPEAFDVLVVDNASSPPVRSEALAPLHEQGRPARIVVEPALGLPQARLRALAETTAPWLLFVDDDNELADDFVAEGLAFVAAERQVGAFGGRLVLPPGTRTSPWVAPFLAYLGLKDEGDQTIVHRSETYGPWEPPGAGLFVRREVLEAYRERLRRDPRGLMLGRRGRGMLASCDDSLLVRQAPHLGLSTAYVPRLRLVHHLDPARFRFAYLLRLLTAFGRSLALLEALVNDPSPIPRAYRGLRGLVTTWHGYRIGRRRSYRYGLAMASHHLAAWRTWRRLAAEHPVLPALDVAAGAPPRRLAGLGPVTRDGRQ